MKVQGIFCNDLFVSAIVSEEGVDDSIVTAKILELKTNDKAQMAQHVGKQSSSYINYENIMYWHTHTVDAIEV